MESPEAAQGIETRKKYRGVRQVKSGNWTAYVYDPKIKKVVILGTFKTAEEAAMIYDKAALRIRGCKAKLNFPDSVPARNEVPGSEKGSSDIQKNPGREQGFLGKRPMIGSCQFLPAKVDMEFQIHHLEQQSYTCVLRAFKSQSDAITGAKESLLIELRKEMGVSDEEPQELFSMVDDEELIKEIWKWRAEYGLEESHPTVSPLRVNHDIPPSSGQFPPVQSGMDTIIHLIEKDGYTSVLRAFEARSDAITWEKKSVITELRKELRISEEEHQELLSKVYAEEILNEIRERRIARGLKPGISRPVQREPHPTVSELHNKRKISQAAMSLDVPSSMCFPPGQPSPFRASMKGQKTTSHEDVRENDQDRGIVHGTAGSGASHGLQKLVPRGGEFGKSLKGDSGKHIRTSLNGIVEAPVPQLPSVGKIPQAGREQVNRSQTRALHDGGSRHHDGSKVMVMVSYKDRFMIHFELSLSSTKLEMEKIVAAKLNLPVGGFDVAYQDEEKDWILIGCDEDLRTCFRTSRSSGNATIRMMVVCG